MILSALRQHETYMRSLRPGKVLAGECHVFSVVFDTGQDQTFSKISKRATGFVRHHQLTRARGITFRSSGVRHLGIIFSLRYEYNFPPVAEK